MIECPQSVLEYINSEQGTHYTFTTIGDHYGTKGRTSTTKTEQVT